MNAGRSLRGVRVAVTGASGFCGGHAARAAAAAGADVVSLGRRPGPVGRWVAWDAARETPDLAGADVVIHLAAAVGDPAGGPATEAAFRTINVDGTRRILDAAQARPVVVVSSASVYDPRATGSPVTEDHPLGGQLTAYGRTKAAGDRAALAAGAVVLRPRAVYGPGDRHLLPRLLRAVTAGLLPLPGRDVSMSLTSVENLADACLQATGWAPGAYNIADAEPYRRDETLLAVLRAHGIRARVVPVPVPVAMAAAHLTRLVPTGPALTPYAVDQLARGVVLDIARARGTGWHPRRTLADYLATASASSEPRLRGGVGGGARWRGFGYGRWHSRRRAQ
jgi:nucleoside-diphosphate-sugar epimerase